MAASLKLISHKLCPYVQRAVIALSEKGVWFERIDIEPTRVYDIGDARAFLSGRGINVDEFARALEGKFISAFVRASKPAAGCCASSGCK